MDLQALKAFQSVAKCGSISGAARELNYAQSNITMKIQQLEKELQSPLFYRHNRGTTLTDKGKVLLSYSEKIFQLIEETKKVMTDDETPKGPLAIGSMETTAAARLPELLTNFHREYPLVALTIKTGPTKQHFHDVLQYELDGAFVAGPIEHPNLNYEPLVEEELVLITSNSDSSESFKKIIQEKTVLVFRKGCSYRERLESWLHHEGVFPQKTMEFGTLDGIIGCVSAGLGISLLPQSVVGKYVEDGRIKVYSIPKQFGRVNTIFIYRKDQYIPNALKKFIHLIKQYNYAQEVSQFSTKDKAIR